jgi:enediyne biosynthesis protein E4
VIKNVNTVLSGNAIGLNIVNKSVRHFNVISIQHQKYLMVTMNNDSVQLYTMKTKK